MARKPTAASSNSDDNKKPNTLQRLAPYLIVLGILFCCVCPLYSGVYFYQSGAVKRDTDFQHRRIIPVSDGSDQLELDVTYPKTLWVDQTHAASQTVVFALRYITAPTQVQPYTISFMPSEPAVILTDLEGKRVPSEFVITPTVGTDSPIAHRTFHIRRTLLSEEVSTEIPLDLHIESSSGTPPDFEDELDPIALQPPCSARWRLFLSLVCGPTTPLLAAAGGLVVLVIQEIQRGRDEQEKREKEKRAKQENQEKEERARKEKDEKEIAVALAKIRDLDSLLKNGNISEGARCYVEYLDEIDSKADPMWEHERVTFQLGKTWQEYARPELVDTVELCRDSSSDECFVAKAKSVGPQESAKALEWALENLDEDWKIKAQDGIVLLSGYPEFAEFIDPEVLEGLMLISWSAILRIWPHISFWRNLPLTGDPGLQGNSFGSVQAETDTLLMQRRYRHQFNPRLVELRTPRPTWIIGAAGSGKTAAALILANDAFWADDLSIRNFPAFSIYYPVLDSGIPELGDVARVLAQTLIYYLAIDPTSFLNRPVVGRAAIAHLLALYACPNLALRFHQAGLPTTGDGTEMLRQIEALIENAEFQEPLPDDELLALLSDARPNDSRYTPDGFRYTMVLLDFQKPIGKDGDIESLLDLSNRLARIGVLVKAFLPGVKTETDSQLPIEIKRIQWSKTELRSLLDRRMVNVPELANGELVREKFEFEARKLFPKYLGNLSSADTPGGLIRKYNRLLKDIDQKQDLLTVEDLDEILGPLPLPEQPDKAESPDEAES